MKHLSDVESNIKRLWTESEGGRSEPVIGPQVSTAIDQEIRRLREAVDQLNSSLDKANRRINRLMGEKKQISILLDRRDEQIQRLNRELGGYESGRDITGSGLNRVRRFRSFLLAAFNSLAGRINGQAVEQTSSGISSGDNREIAGAQRRMRVPLMARQSSGVSQSTVILLMVGLAQEEIERLLPIIEKDCCTQNARPLCVIDMDAFEVLRRRDIVFEYLPPLGDRERFDSSLHWELYIQRRLALVRQKWDPVRVIAFGAIAMDTLTLWSSSPFETTLLPAASGQSAVRS